MRFRVGYHIADGHAVALGLIVESRISHQMGYLDAMSLGQIEAVVTNTVLRHMPDVRIPVDQIWGVMQRDKKARQQVPHCVLLRGVGNVVCREGAYNQPVPVCCSRVCGRGTRGCFQGKVIVCEL